MPPERGRASKACQACRRQKTRCYETITGQACLRCDRLGLECSLCIEMASYSQNMPSAIHNVEHERFQESEKRIERLEERVAELTKGLEDAEAFFSARLQDLESVLSRQTQGARVQETIPHNDDAVQHDLGDIHEPDAAPLFLLRDVTTQSGFQATNRTETSIPAVGSSSDIITKGLLSEQEAGELLALFQWNYGRWVSFHSVPPIMRFLQEVRKSPFLLAACCLIAVRHTTQEKASRLAPKLFEEAKNLMSLAILNVPQSIEFFQAALVLSLWSTTIGQVPLSIDSWLLSGFALQHSVASELFVTFVQGRQRSLNKDELDRLCIWNHLCLAHLHYCVGTRRRAVLVRGDIDRCRLILGSDHATNFESRMVAEVHLYWIIYESCSGKVDLPKTLGVLNSWKGEWSFLLNQPQSQYLQMGFHFAQLLIHDQSLKTQPASIRESILSEMIRLSTSIINLAMDTADDQTTRHLTDHIYHMISFAAVTLCRLLHNYEHQLSSSHDLQSLDTLILSLVSCLHGIGLPCHVAHTMGDVVAAFHKKLRPDSGTSPSTSYAGVDPAIQDDFAHLFPEFYGAESFDVINGSMLPDFQPIL